MPLVIVKHEQPAERGHMRQGTERGTVEVLRTILFYLWEAIGELCT